MAPATLTLTPATGPQGGGHTSTHGGATTGDPDFAALIEAGDDGPGPWSVAGWVLAALAVAAAGVLAYRGRHRAEPTEDDDEPQKDDGPREEPVSAGAARVTSWSYRDGPG
jgi:hypothetical protein